MEANKWVWASTPHKCDAPSDLGHYTTCDSAGTCHKNTAEGFDFYVFGPSDEYTINSLNDFHVKLDFSVDENNSF